MLLPDAALPPSSTAFGVPEVDVSALYQPTDDYVVQALAQTERIRPTDSKIVPTIAVSFRVPGLPGVFVIHIDNYAFVYADPLLYLRERAWLIRSLYALPATLPPFVDTSSEVAA